MKKTHLYFSILISIAILISFNSCTNFEEGPHFSFRKPETRILGTWTIQKTLVNDLVCDSLYNQEINIVYEFLDNNNLKISKIINGETTHSCQGYWSFNKDNNHLSYKLDNDTIEEEYRVTRLTNKEMWIIYEPQNQHRKISVIEKRFIKSN